VRKPGVPTARLLRRCVLIGSSSCLSNLVFNGSKVDENEFTIFRAANQVGWFDVRESPAGCGCIAALAGSRSRIA